jgi:hypothetical protein
MYLIFTCSVFNDVFSENLANIASNERTIGE